MKYFNLTLCYISINIFFMIDGQILKYFNLTLCDAAVNQRGSRPAEQAQGVFNI